MFLVVFSLTGVKARTLDPKFMLEIEDEILMLMRTIFKRAFGNRFYRVVITRFSNHKKGIVIQSAVLVGKLHILIYKLESNNIKHLKKNSGSFLSEV